MPEFYGNMGSPASVWDYKNYYGVWPPGLDDSIAPAQLTLPLSGEQLDKIARLYLQYRSTVQWYEVHRALQRLGMPLTSVFERARALNEGRFPNTLTNEEFLERYSVLPPLL